MSHEICTGFPAIVAAALCLTFPCPSHAASMATVDGVEWTYSLGSWRIDGWESSPYGVYLMGDRRYGDVAVSRSTTGAITIPPSLGGYPVKVIYDDAFYGCYGLTSVSIPDSVEFISSTAFATCGGLMSFSVGVGNAYYKSVDGLLLSKDGKTLIHGVAGDVTVPDSVTSIGAWAFYGCSGLTSVTIPESVTNIGERAFFCCGLTSVMMADSVIMIGDNAFAGCKNLNKVKISAGLKGFSETVFDGCDALRAEWYRRLADLSASEIGSVGSPSVVTTVVHSAEAPYTLTDYSADRSIASVTINGDCVIDSFVLKDGAVYDCVLRIVNTASKDVTVTLPSGYEYETFEGVAPLTIPANSRNILTITRTADRTFLVSRQRLRQIQ